MVKNRLENKNSSRQRRLTNLEPYHYGSLEAAISPMGVDIHACIHIHKHVHTFVVPFFYE